MIADTSAQHLAPGRPARPSRTLADFAAAIFAPAAAPVILFAFFAAKDLGDASDPVIFSDFVLIVVYGYQLALLPTLICGASLLTAAVRCPALRVFPAWIAIGAAAGMGFAALLGLVAEIGPVLDSIFFEYLGLAAAAGAACAAAWRALVGHAFWSIAPDAGASADHYEP